MKYFRHLTIAFTFISTATIATAQSFELRGANLEGNVFKVIAGTGIFTVDVWYIPGASLNVWTPIQIIMGHGTAASSFVTTNSNSPLTYVNNSATTAVPGFGNVGPAQLRGAPNPFAGTNNPLSNAFGATAVRPFAVRATWAVFGGANDPDVALKVASFSFAYTMAYGDIFGDETTECGLLVYRSGPQGVGSLNNTSGMGNTPFTSSFRIGSAKYQVEAVPEPGTMAAIAAGVAAMAARRRKNSKA